MKSKEDILSRDEICAILQSKDYSCKIHLYETLGSTNKTLKEMFYSGANHGTIVIAEHQSAGRGRLGRNFHSPKGCGIYMSVLLETNFLSNDVQSLVTPFVAIEVCDAIEKSTGKNPKVKWVNDLFLDGKKICGILTEAMIEPDTAKAGAVIVGIGINFSTKSNDFPYELRKVARSLFENEIPNVTRNQLIAEIAGNLFRRSNINKNQILDEYNAKMFLFGKSVVVSNLGNSEPFEAVVIGLNDFAQLIVRDSNGKEITLIAGDVSIKM